ncbi:MAG: mRNA surveillance protein pelota [Nanobdellota archaeon]
MKLIKKDYSKGIIKIEVENNDDLWHLSHIINNGDKVKADTFRKIKIGEGDDRNSKVIKKKIVLQIDVEKVEFHKYSDILRISGKISLGPDDIPLGSYHTINVENKTVLTLIKPKFYDFQIEKIKEASRPKKLGILICVFDREEAIFAHLKTYGYEVLSKIKGNVAKKDDPSIKSDNFYSEIAKNLEEYSKKYNINKIILGSSAFWKEYLLNNIKDEKLKSMIITASCNNVGNNGINEILKRPEVVSALKEDRIIQETQMVEKLLKKVQKDENAAYGLDDVNKAIQSGAVKELLVSDNLILKRRQENSYDELDELIKKANSTKAKINIISSEHEAGQKLDGIGGIGALLRFKV